MLSINELIDKFVKNNLMIFKSILIKVFMNIYYYFYTVVFFTNTCDLIVLIYLIISSLFCQL